VGAEVLGELDSGRTDRARRAVDEHVAALERTGGPQAGEGKRCSVAHGRSLRERQTLGHVRDHPGSRNGDELGVGARARSEDAMADRELGDPCADLSHDAGELHAEYAPLRPEDSRHEPADDVLGAAKPAVGSCNRRRVHTNQHVVVGRSRPLERLDVQDFGRPIAVVRNGLHRPFRGGRRSGHGSACRRAARK